MSSERECTCKKRWMGTGLLQGLKFPKKKDPNCPQHGKRGEADAVGFQPKSEDVAEPRSGCIGPFSSAYDCPVHRPTSTPGPSVDKAQDDLLYRLKKFEAHEKDVGDRYGAEVLYRAIAEIQRLRDHLTRLLRDE